MIRPLRALLSFSRPTSLSSSSICGGGGGGMATNIIKSAQDDRSYKGIELSNGLRALLVSDPTTDMSAAAVDVNVGSAADPRHIPGLAHFCEHMLFMGTEKYPDENEYNRYLSQNGGGSNAYTSGDHTNYYFDVRPEAFGGALDRFAQFFLQPLFTASSTDREINAVNSEHEKNLASDAWRLKQLEHSLCDPQHDYNKFGTGSKDTLATVDNIREELLKFHAENYSSNIMTLAVLGKESLDELESMVTELFQNVENKKVRVPEWPKHPFLPEENRIMCTVLPVKDVRLLHITFPIPDLHPLYKTAPGHYLGHLIGHEGKGSLLSELKNKGWVNSLVGGQKSGYKGFGFFIIQVDLTEEGMEKVFEIVEMSFQYLNMLRKTKPQKWIYDECRNIYSMSFRFKDKERPQGYVSSLASDLHFYPFEDVLAGGYLLEDSWRPELITGVLDELVPENVRISVIAKKFEGECDQTEKWYGTKYKVQSVPDHLLKIWGDENNVNESLQLPHPNEFIPSNFDLCEREQNWPEEHPMIIAENELTRIWFKQDNEFLRPKGAIDIEFTSPLNYLDPHHTNLSRMFVRMFRDDLNEFAYEAELAGLRYSLSNTKNGISLSIRGYNEKQSVLLEKIIGKMCNFSLNEDRFRVLREAYQRNLKNFKMEQPHQHAIFYCSTILSEKTWIHDECLAEMDALTAENLLDFVPRLLSRLHIEALVHGNYTRTQARNLIESVETILKEKAGTRPVPKSQLMSLRELSLRENSCSYLEKTNDVHKSSCIESYYQVGVQEPAHINMTLELFAQLAQEPAFDTLRTKEQLGYIVWSGTRRSGGAQGFRVIIQSDRHPAYLDERIENFLRELAETVSEMPEEEFERNKEALAVKRLEKPKRMYSRTAKYWSEIASKLYHFDRDEAEVDVLRTLTKKDLMSFYEDFISADSKKRKKFSTHVISMAEDGAGKTADEKKASENGSKIDDPVVFRKSHALLSLPLPIKNIESFIKF